MDLWCGEEALFEAFSALFYIARDKEALVTNYLSWHNGVLHWEALFTRDPHGWEIGHLQDIFDLHYSVKTNRDGEDHMQ